MLNEFIKMRGIQSGLKCEWIGGFESEGFPDLLGVRHGLVTRIGWNDNLTATSFGGRFLPFLFSFATPLELSSVFLETFFGDR